MCYHPTIGNKGIDNACIVGVVANRNLTFFYERISKRVGPVKEVFNFDSASRRNFSGTLWCRRHRGNAEIVVEGNKAVRTLTRLEYSRCKGLPRTLTEA